MWVVLQWFGIASSALRLRVGGLWCLVIVVCCVRLFVVFDCLGLGGGG